MNTDLLSCAIQPFHKQKEVHSLTHKLLLQTLSKCLGPDLSCARKHNSLLISAITSCSRRIPNSWCRRVATLLFPGHAIMAIEHPDFGMWTTDVDCIDSNFSHGFDDAKDLRILHVLQQPSTPSNTRTYTHARTLTHARTHTHTHTDNITEDRENNQH